TPYAHAWNANNTLNSRTITTAATTESFGYTYSPGAELVATTDPQAAIPVLGAFDADDNHTAIGADTYTYDALHQLAATTNTTTNTTITYQRDAHGRITTHTSTAPDDTYHLAYSLPDDQRPTVTIDPAGTAT